MSQREVVVLSGVRTAIADFGGSLKDVPPTELAGQVVAEAVKRSGLAGEDIGHCVIGSVTHSDRRDMYMSRVAALKGGLPIELITAQVARDVHLIAKIKFGDLAAFVAWQRLAIDTLEHPAMMLQVRRGYRGLSVGAGRGKTAKQCN